MLTPAGLKNVATGSFIKSLCESVDDVREIEGAEIWESLMVILSPQKFAAMLRGVCQDQPSQGELDFQVRYQNNINMPFHQQYILPGQGSPTDIAHIFKMTTKGEGSGVDLLRQMQPGGALEGTWVSFDVMKRLTMDWCTFSPHVYDHNYRALCTIFTCELMLEDTKSFEKAWRIMLDVARKNGIGNPTIYGFMADNQQSVWNAVSLERSQSAWNAVRNVFFGGVPNPERERTDAFHFYQCFHQHSIVGVHDNQQGEHGRLWDSMRAATSFVEAYKISREIDAWWQAGNCVPEKLKELQSWKAWWVVR